MGHKCVAFAIMFIYIYTYTYVYINENMYTTLHFPYIYEYLKFTCPPT